MYITFSKTGKRFEKYHSGAHESGTPSPCSPPNTSPSCTSHSNGNLSSPLPAIGRWPYSSAEGF